MFESIVNSIICSEFQQRFCRGGEIAQGNMSSPDKAMLVKFSLSPSYAIEDGYRNLHILIFGGGSNYISVFAKVDWAVIRNEWSDGNDYLKAGREYIQGETPWVFYGCHDSCWRDSVRTIIGEFHKRINSIDWVFGGWYKTITITEEYAKGLKTSRNTGYKGGGRQSDWKKASELQFHFDVTDENNLDDL